MNSTSSFTTKEEYILIEDDDPSQLCILHHKMTEMFCQTCECLICPSRCFDNHFEQGHQIFSLQKFMESNNDDYENYLAKVEIRIKEMEMMISEKFNVSVNEIGEIYYKLITKILSEKNKKIANLKENLENPEIKKHFRLQISENQSIDIRDILHRKPANKIEDIKIFKDWLDQISLNTLHQKLNSIVQEYIADIVDNEDLKSNKELLSTMSLKSAQKKDIYCFNIKSDEFKLSFIDLSSLNTTDYSEALWSLSEESKPNLILPVENDISGIYPIANQLNGLILNVKESSRDNSEFQNELALLFRHFESLSFLKINIENPNFSEFLEIFPKTFSFLRKLKILEINLPAGYDPELIAHMLKELKKYLPKLNRFSFKCEYLSESIVVQLAGLINSLPKIKGLCIKTIKSAKNTEITKIFYELILKKFNSISCLEFHLEFGMIINNLFMVATLQDILSQNPIKSFGLTFNLPFSEIPAQTIFNEFWSTVEKSKTLQSFKFVGLREFNQTTWLDYNLPLLMRSISSKKMQHVQINLSDNDYISSQWIEKTFSAIIKNYPLKEEKIDLLFKLNQKKLSIKFDQDWLDFDYGTEHWAGCNNFAGLIQMIGNISNHYPNFDIICKMEEKAITRDIENLCRSFPKLKLMC